jgi:mono/diheme cytochrome c family protein
MTRPVKVLLASSAVIVAAVLLAACGTENIKVSQSSPLREGAVLFNQRCAGCHTFSYAATHGSAANVRTAQFNNGPNFDIRCERPVTRVLYAIQNGGFSGGIMPQNVVVGQQAVEVAKFVATYAGSKAPKVPGTIICNQQPLGTLPSPTATTANTSSPPQATKTTASTGTKSGAKKRGSGKRKTAHS